MASFLASLPTWERVVLALFVAAVAHGLVRAIRSISSLAMSSEFASQITKTRTIVSLTSSTLIFVLYFAAVGFALNELGISLTTYLASASIIGLAVAFGSQGLVQDVVSGLTVVFTNLFDIGDLIEISGQVGVVEKFGMRFTVLRNAMGAEVIVPNRSILNVVRYARGYIRCLVDIALPDDDKLAIQVQETASELTKSAAEQFPGVLRAHPEIVGPIKTEAGKSLLADQVSDMAGSRCPDRRLLSSECAARNQAAGPGLRRLDDYCELRSGTLYCTAAAIGRHAVKDAGATIMGCRRASLI